MNEILVERAEGVVTVTLNRPERKNAVDVPMWGELLRIFGEVAEREDDRVLVFTGAGGVFCAGGDLSDADPDLSGGNSAESAFAAMRDTVGAACHALHVLPKPSIAAVDGVAAGAGANLAFGCDLVLASDRARFAELFVRRALPLDSGGSWLLPRLVGPQKAKELAFFGDFVEAAEARDLGLVNRVVPAEELAELACSWALRLVAQSATALAAIKRGIDSALERTLAEALDAEARDLAACVETPEFGEAIRCFLKRKR